MSRRFGLYVMVLALGCGGDGPELPDLMCEEPGVAIDEPGIGCQEVVDLGCLNPEGAPLEVDFTVQTCDGSEATVSCSPEVGGIIREGSPSEGTCTATSMSGATARCDFEIRYRIDGPARLDCASVEPVECAGARTEVPIPGPSRVASCSGGEIGTPTSDAPDDGFELGTTTVAFQAEISDGGSLLDCAVEVEVEDTTAPTVDCSMLPEEIVRAAADDEIDFGEPIIVEDCDASPEVEFGPIPEGSGMTTVTATATDATGLSGSCTVDVQVFDVFPVTGLRVISATSSASGTEVTLGWTPSEGADVDGLRIERSDSEDGPFAEWMMVGPGTTTLTDDDPADDGYYRIVSLAGEREGGISNVVRARAVDSANYNLSGESVPGVPFPTSITGIVRAPMAGTGPHPLVMFMHGNHGNCRPPEGEDQCEERTAHECSDGRFTTTPNADGYVYLQDTLASLGFVTVSISANAMNCRADFIPQRTSLLLEHLRRWSAWSTAAAGPLGDRFVGEVDMSRVALVGHSRGGEAVSSAPAALEASPIDGVALSSVFAIGPTDFHDPNPSGSAFHTLLPACDADVRDLAGIAHYDRGLPTLDDTNLRSQVLFLGANHNFFNTEWRFDDNDGRTRVCTEAELVGGAAQRGMLEYALIDWAVATTSGESLPAYVRTDAPTPDLMQEWAASDLDLRWSYSGAERVVIDDFAGAGAPNTNDLGGMNEYIDQIATVSCTGACSRNLAHSNAAVRLAWQNEPAAATFSFPATEARPDQALSMRFASRLATINNGLESHDFDVVLEDAAGVRATVSLAAHGRLAHRYPSRVEREILSTVRIPVQAFIEVEPTLDTSRLVQVAFEMPRAGGNVQGSIWVDDLEFAGE